ncbi:MAG: DUF2390 domain-containing protein [Oleiphilaceae bacterium]|nr:DUF2390 domain-containing protein [Oleiphilaceae bacterium]
MIRQHPPHGLELDNPLWQMAGRYWQRPAFESACLAAQSDGWSVSHILVALFSAAEGLWWDAREPEPIRHWREDVTERLRALRQSLHREATAVAPLRQGCKQAELESERVELAWWYSLMRDGNPHWRAAQTLAFAGRVSDNLQQLFQDAGALHARRIATAISHGATHS